MRWIRALGVTVCLLAAGCPSGAAAAQPAQISPGVFADPNSPAGKEYALQLQSARNTGSAPTTGASHPSTLFGSGIKAAAPTPPPTAAAPVSVRPRPRRQVRPTPGPAAGRLRVVPSTSSAVPAATGFLPAAPQSGAGTLALAGGAAAILAAGLVGGILLRRRRPGDPTTDPTG